MQLTLDNDSLPVYEALASEVRLKILRLLCEQKMNVKDLAAELRLSSPIMTMHVRKLATAGLIKTERVPGKSGSQKLSALAVDNIEVKFPKRIIESFKIHEVHIPVGHYADYKVEPTCGLATLEGFVGNVDDIRYFSDPKRVNAAIIWFSKGFVEYKVPNFLSSDEKPEMLELSFEISSEFPFTNNNWPSDIHFVLNGQELGCWTSPGDFGDTRGIYTPAWWPLDINQYGLLKKLLVTTHGTYMDGDKISGVSIKDIDAYRSVYTFSLAVREGSPHVGGLTIFGKGFGNYDDDIVVRMYYSNI
ncbi:MAG: helix-turn-helix domain-containing protein [Clostridiales bacterium]|jgi:predicted transcriptional regulator|nr:helix-turn-helix domain-containing protein [Clostridiales bacterium]